MAPQAVKDSGARIAQLEHELDEMTAALAQAWDQLVPFLKAPPGPAESPRDIMPILESIMAAVDAEMGMVYLAADQEHPAECITLPSDAIHQSVLQRYLDTLPQATQLFHAHGVPAWTGLSTHWMFMPLLVSRRAVGLIGVGISQGGREFSVFDARTLMRMTERAAGQIVAAHLEESQAREEQLTHELQIAGLIQRSLQPASSPSLPGFQVAANWEPAASVGGDAWGWVLQPSGKLACFLLDVAGKGLPAALAAVSLHTATKMTLKLGLSPEDAIRAVNEEFYAAYTDSGIMATEVILTIDPATGIIEHANAGHPPTLLRLKDTWRQWEATTPPLGVLPDAMPRRQQACLETGDLVVCYSDGYSEIETAQGLWGSRGLIEAVTADARSAEQIISAIRLAALRTRGNRTAHDDQTLLTLCRTDRTVATLKKSLVLTASFEALPGLEAFVDDLDESLPEETGPRIKLALHELCMNIVQHGYAGHPGKIQVEAEFDGEMLTLIVRDTAPVAYPNRDISPPNPLDLPESGWGMHILAQVMDEMQYQRLADGNLWQLVKRLRAS